MKHARIHALSKTREVVNSIFAYYPKLIPDLINIQLSLSSLVSVSNEASLKKEKRNLPTVVLDSSALSLFLFSFFLNDLMSQGYQELIHKESRHWGNVRPDSENPQIWDDPSLYAIFFLKEHLYLVNRVVANGPKVLELGCGEGNFAIELSDKGMDVTALDLSPERIHRAKEKSKNLSNPPSFQIEDLNTVSLPASSFDCIVANGSLHHILALDHLLDEVQQSLKPSGKLLVFDFVGMGFVRKFFAAFFYAILPTYKSYSDKWRLRSRVKSFLSSEEKKKQAVIDNDASSLHPDSPFEEISQGSIVEEISKRFTILGSFSFLPFCFYLAPKIRLPRLFRYRCAKLFRSIDDSLVRYRLATGAYIFIEAQKA